MLLLHGEVDNGNCCGKSLSSREETRDMHIYLIESSM